MTQYTITDGTLSVSFTDSSGFNLLFDGWQPRSTSFKGGGTYGNSAIADGRILRHAVYDNVTESYKTVLNFTSTDDMINQVDDLEELLLNRAPRYWLDRFYNDPVYITRQLDGETKISYALISQGNVVKPTNWFDNMPIVNQKILPVLIQVNRQPFWLGAIPGTAQKSVSVSAQQSWTYAQAWAVETALPAGSVYEFAQIANGNIYAAAGSEIMLYTDSTDTWSVATTAPIVIGATACRSCTALDNGDVLFGENGRIIKRSSGGTWSEETTLATTLVLSIMEASTSEVFAGDLQQILRRDVNGSWTAESTSSIGFCVSLLEDSNGVMWAGGAQIWRTATAGSTTDVSVQVSSSTDDAEQHGTSMDLTSNDLDLFQGRYIGLRFQSVAIPNGATINSAVVEFTAEENEAGVSGVMDIYCEDVDDAATFTSAASDISNRTLTTAKTTWTNAPTWAGGNTYDTTDFTSAVQEIVNRAGWATGQDMNVILVPITSTNDRDAESYDGNSGDAPTLKINYTTAPAAGAAWELNSTYSTACYALAEVDGVLFGTDSGKIISSDDNGLTWSDADTTPTGFVYALRNCNGVFYCGDSSNILKSTDLGNNWVVDDTLPTGQVYDILCAADNTVYAGDTGQVLSLTADTFTPGQEASSTSPTFVANHHTEAQMTHIYNDNGGEFSSIYPISDYMIRDNFTTAIAAGSIDGTTVEEGPGVRAIVDTESKLSIG